MPQGWTEPNSFHVCITSYKQFFRGYAALTRVRWRCLVIDEMQRVKGLSERHWEAVFTLQRSAWPCGLWGAEGSVTQMARVLGTVPPARTPVFQAPGGRIVTP